MKTKWICTITLLFFILGCWGEVSAQTRNSKKKLKVTQTGNRKKPDKSGMSSNAFELVSKMTMGWNLGNTMEAIGGETNWGNPKTTEAMIKALKDKGYNTVRIPCSWNHYLEDQTTYKIKDSWLTRVKEVVDYCVDNDMYAILNIHWDEGWLENNCTPDKQDAVNIKQNALWEQIAVYFRDYDEHLLFAGCNEPNAKDAEQMKVLLSYEQTFVDAVRRSGGRNAYRNLIVQGPETDIDRTDELMIMPNDPVAKDRMIIEVHYYSPYQFCLMPKDETWGKVFYFWGKEYQQYAVGEYEGRWATWGGEEYLGERFGKIKRKFVDKGIPGIIGEFCAGRRTFADPEIQEIHDRSRGYFHACVTEMAKNNGLVPFLWDTGGTFDRHKGMAVIDPYVYEGMVKGAKAGKYPF